MSAVATRGATGVATLTVYAAPGMITVSVADGRPVSVEDPTGHLHTLGIERFDLTSLSLFPLLELPGRALELSVLGYWRRPAVGTRSEYVLPSLVAA
jgi:hypothetical protein